MPLNILPNPDNPIVDPKRFIACGSNSPVASTTPDKTDDAAGKMEAASPNPVAPIASFPNLEKSFFETVSV